MRIIYDYDTIHDTPYGFACIVLECQDGRVREVGGWEGSRWTVRVEEGPQVRSLLLPNGLNSKNKKS